MDRGAWWATVHRVANSQTRLKLLSTHTCLDFNFKTPASIAPHQRFSLSFEALKPGIDFSLALKVLAGIFFQQKTVSSTVSAVQCRLLH